jgi:hypothetical protein
MMMRFFRTVHVYRLELSITRDMANRLVLCPAGFVHFHLKTHSTQREEWDKTFQKERSTILARPTPTYNSATTSCLAHKLNPHNLISQDRAHNVIGLHWKYTKHRRHGNLFNPGWPSTSVLPRVHYILSRHVAPGQPLNLASSYKPFHPSDSLKL